MDFKNVKAAMTSNFIYNAKTKIIDGLKEGSSKGETGDIFMASIFFDKKEQVLLKEYGYIVFALDLVEGGIFVELEDDFEGCTATCYRRVD